MPINQKKTTRWSYQAYLLWLGESRPLLFSEPFDLLERRPLVAPPDLPKPLVCSWGRRESGKWSVGSCATVDSRMHRVGGNDEGTGINVATVLFEVHGVVFWRR